MALLSEELRSANRWRRKKNAVTLTQDGDTAMLHRVTKSGRSTQLFSGTLAEAANHMPKGASLIAGMPVSACVARVVTAPMDNLVKARHIMPGLLDTDLPFPIEDCHYAFVQLKQKGQGQSQAIGLASRIKDVQAKIHELEAVGLDPEVLVHPGLALWAEAEREKPSKGASRAVLHLESDRVVVSLGESGSFLQSQSFRMDPRKDAAEVTRRMKRVLQAMPGQSPNEWVVSGSQADQAGTILSGLDARHALVKEPKTFLARALAVENLQAGPLAMNFRAGEDLHPSLATGLKRRAFRSCMHFLLSGALLCGGAYAWRAYQDQRKQNVQKQISSLTKSIVGYTVPPGYEVRKVEEMIGKEGALLSHMQEGSNLKLAQEMLADAGRYKLEVFRFRVEQGLAVLDGVDMNRQGSSAMKKKYEPRGGTLSYGDVTPRGIRFSLKVPTVDAEAGTQNVGTQRASLEGEAR